MASPKMSEKTSLFLILIASFFTISSSMDGARFKAFRSLKTPKVNKHKLSLIIQRLKANDSTKITSLETVSDKCPQFTLFTFCACGPTCIDMEPLCEGCKPGCVCRNGFVRNTKTSECVLPEECPRKTTRFELEPPRRIYEAVPIMAPAFPLPEPPAAIEDPSTTTPKTPEEENQTTSFNFFDEPKTVPLLILRSGPTPPPSPPTLNMLQPQDEFIGAPSATPPPDFVYGPPGMNAAKYVMYDNYLKQKRIMKALRQRRNRFMKKF